MPSISIIVPVYQAESYLEKSRPADSAEEAE